MYHNLTANAILYQHMHNTQAKTLLPCAKLAAAANVDTNRYSWFLSSSHWQT